MISPTDLQALIEKIDGGTKGVDLVKIGQVDFGAHPRSLRRLRVALDIEGCLDRFYGGYYSDWACGGQFNRCFQFVQLLVNAFQAAEMDVVVFFDGTLKENKRAQMDRNDFRQRTISVLKHIRMIGTPPPKIWWLPPSGLRTCLRNSLRTFNIPVVQTIHDHTMEVIDYFHEHKLNAIIGLHPDYIIFCVSRYFSSHDLRLSYKGALETKEYMVAKLFTHLELAPEQMPILAVLLGGYILIDEPTLKKIYQKLNVEYNQDFETRIRQLADLIRPIPSGSSAEVIIRHLSLTDFSDMLKESIEYYQRKGIFGGKRYLGSKKKPITEIFKNIDVIQDTSATIVPMASETKEDDEMAHKILKDVNNLVNETSDEPIPGPSSETSRVKCVKFVYSLPAEVLRTSYQRHQRGHMDSRIYILLTKKEILLPQLLEDEQYREMPSIQVFYRPARQMIYAVLFNLYHQKYMCSKTKDNLPSPDVIINEWTWSPQNEYKKAEEVYAKQLPWAVPTIQRLWFGTTFDDKHRRMRAFLTVMRSDTSMMLNRNHVPQHLLVLACVLRYIITCPEKNIITRHELDAFIATAFSPQLVNVDYTQEMVLPGVYLRGVFLATLFMQGVETAQLANDACGVPLPWNLTNPWLFFDGKLFHLKLRMALSFQNLRELCDDQLDIVMKVDRFRKAVMEDLDSKIVSQDQMLQRGMFQNAPFSAQVANAQAQYGQQNQKQMQYPINYNYGPMQQQQMFYAAPNMMGGSFAQQRQMQSGPNKPQQMQLQKGRGGVINFQKATGNQYQLKVGGVVVGSWAQNRSQIAARNRAGMIRLPLNNQRAQRGAINRYRTSGVNRFVNNNNNTPSKQKKVKSKKETTKRNAKDDENECDENSDEGGSDEENITKDDVEGNKSAENGNQSEEPHESDDNRNGTDTELCDKKSSDDLTTTTAILDVLSLNDETQDQSATSNGKGKGGKKNKKKGGKADEQVSSSSDALKA